MDRNKKSLIIRIISVILSFILSFLIFTDVLFIIAKFQLFSPKALENAMNNTNYYSKMANEIEDDYVSYGMASGFPEKFFKNIIDRDFIKIDIVKQCEKMYSGKYEPLQDTKIYDSMYSSFITYANENDYEVTNEVDKNIKYLAQTCAEHYVDYVDIPFASSISVYLPKISQICIYAIIFCTIGIAVCVVMLFLLQSWKHRSIRYYMYSMTTACLMFIIFPTAIYATGKITKVATLSKAVYDLIVAFLQTFLNTFFVFAVISVVIIIMLLFLHNAMRKKVKYHHN